VFIVSALSNMGRWNQASCDPKKRNHFASSVC